MTSTKKIPFLDLVAPHLELESELVSVFKNALRTGSFVGGPLVGDFEREFAAFCGVEYCIGVGSGTDALRFALIAGGVRPGDTVITVPNTFIATAEAISQAGALPDFVDIDQRSYNMDPLRLQQYLESQCLRDHATGNLWSRKTGRRVTAIVPVHLYGQIADMDAILGLAEKYKLMVIEDACQAHGAEYFSKTDKRWKRAGSIGAAAAFSFYPGKNLGACGEAGAVTTGDPTIAERVRMLRDHGQLQKYKHEIEGYNGRLDSIQAGILRAKLKCLAEWNNRRREIAHRYGELLRSFQGVTLPHEAAGSKGVYHLYVIRVRNRDRLQAHLTLADVTTQIHYPTPLHLQRPYESLGYGKGDFPVAEQVASEILSLPMYPHLTLDQQTQVVRQIANILSLPRLRTMRKLEEARAA